MYKGVDTDTDYYLTLTDLRLKMLIEWKINQKTFRKYDVDKLRNKETLQTFKETVTYFLEKKEKSGEKQVEESWKIIKTSLMKSTERVILINKCFNDICKWVFSKCNEDRIKAIHTPSSENIRDFENKRKEVTIQLHFKWKYKNRKRGIRRHKNFKHKPREFFKPTKQSKVDLYQLYKW